MTQDVLSDKSLYLDNNIDTAKSLMFQAVSKARNAEYKHSSCPEELESLQMLCQFLHGHTTNPDHAKIIEWVFTELDMASFLQLT